MAGDPTQVISVPSGISHLGLLLFVAALVAILTRRLSMPYTVGLVLAGMGLSLTDAGSQLHLSKDMIFTLFLPPLVFEAALCIRWREFKRDLPVLALLATVGVALAAAVTAIGMHYLLLWNWDIAIVFGVLIAATDPVSVIATFKEAGVEGRLRLLIEAESLLNDGTAAVAFVAVLSVLSGEHATVLAVGTALLLTIGGGVIVGAAVGVASVVLIGQTRDRLVDFTLTTLAAYGSFFAAERLQCSGVLAALSAGMVVGNRRALSLSGKEDDSALSTFWEYAAFVANSLIFILIGARVARQHFGGLWLGLLGAIGLVLLGRAIAVYPLCAAFARGRRKVDINHQHILVWGGLRGALALALSLALPDDLPQRDAVITTTFAVVAFSVFVQGLTIVPLLRRLGQIK